MTVTYIALICKVGQNDNDLTCQRHRIGKSDRVRKFMKAWHLPLLSTSQTPKFLNRNTTLIVRIQLRLILLQNADPRTDLILSKFTEN